MNPKTGRSAVSLILYELTGRNGECYSQFSWRSRLALAHMGLETETRPVRVSDKETIAFSGQKNVPILVAGSTVVPDSWRIAEYLAAEYPSKPSLFGCEAGRGLARFVNAWVDRQVIPHVVPLLMIDVIDCVDVEDGLHLRGQMEKAFRNTLETLAENRNTDIVAFRRLLDPARTTLRAQPFLSGSKPAYADYILFSVFQWARIVSRCDLLESGDAVADWRERMLDLFGGLARAEPARSGP
jgi:glutathione S-transferase